MCWEEAGQTDYVLVAMVVLLIVVNPLQYISTHSVHRICQGQLPDDGNDSSNRGHERGVDGVLSQQCNND